ncbi:ubiquinol-cytochrome C chaperone family protein [Parvularcula oceani]|uniref:ubiquinol-cytochrome C chaperone family protein n=1 Tax=Parvularcula oceani TaxID=1247963 RepID=UPI00068FDEFC|nr:ubiquinol-cytochrome C chaperone family protein [Parvularcula oceani]
MVFGFLKSIARRAFGHDPRQVAAVDLYTEIVEQARSPVLYEEYGVPDTVDGRYDLLTLHMVLVLRRLKREGEGRRGFSQQLFYVMFRNMDDSLREMGVGDLKVGKKVRELAEAFYGRLGAYETAFEKDGDAALRSALGRNIYGQEDAPEAARLAAYARAADTALAGQPAATLTAGRVAFPDPADIPQELRHDPA